MSLRTPKEIKRPGGSNLDRTDLFEINGKKSGNSGDAKTIVVIDERALIRDCLANCLQAKNDHHNVLTFASVAAWQAVATSHPPATVIMLSSSGRGGGAPELERDLMLLADVVGRIPVVVIGDADHPGHILDTLKKGARGYIPTTMTFNIANEALHFVEAGGTFVPASTLIESTTNLSVGAGIANGPGDFTVRQAEIVKCIRSGKANKQIAYELNMCESTVKSHIRTIMKKLNARNRTEIAIFAGEARRDSVPVCVTAIGAEPRARRLS